MNEQAGSVSDAFGALARVLAEEKLPHAFIGALAALAWGRIRTTTDVDVVVVMGADGLAALERRLTALGARPAAPVGVDESGEPPDIAVFWYPGSPPVRFDVFVAKTAFEREVVGTSRDAQVLGLRVPLARPEASIVYKLLASRGKDLDDVEAVFVGRAAAGEPLDWPLIERWCADWDIADRLAPYQARFKK